MLREPPDGANLLATAREVVLRELLPALPESAQFAARMVANAMAIAGREAAQDPSWEAGALSRVAALVGDAEDPLRAFAAAIRAGRFDGDAEAFAVLREITRKRCEVSAPRVLKDAGRE